MKNVRVSDSDYKKLRFLGSDKWLTVSNEKPLSAEKVVHSLIEDEYRKAKPPEDYGPDR